MISDKEVGEKKKILTELNMLWFKVEKKKERKKSRLLDNKQTIK